MTVPVFFCVYLYRKEVKTAVLCTALFYVLDLPSAHIKLLGNLLLRDTVNK